MIKTMNSINVNNVYELTQAIGSLMLQTPSSGDGESVYVVDRESDSVNLTLEEDTLTDGSKVYQIRIV